ncbi:MAG: 50S ribosomal protein L32e [Methanomicrobiaceae archaeon]|nr:50S ribosomal protein L32e [Methanomicrobiaceae archaeon]
MADEIKRLIRARARNRATFKRQGISRKKKLEDVWRRPRGLQSKQRRQYRAKGRHPKPGFGAPARVRGFHPSGYEEVRVCNVADLEGLDAATQAVRIGGTVGNRKREAIQVKSLEYGLKVLNPKEIVSPEAEVTDDE